MTKINRCAVDVQSPAGLRIWRLCAQRRWAPDPDAWRRQDKLVKQPHACADDDRIDVDPRVARREAAVRDVREAIGGEEREARALEPDRAAGDLGLEVDARRRGGD